MKINLNDMLILIIPVIIIILLMPVLPDKIHIQWSLNSDINWYFYKRFYSTIGTFPFIVYESYRIFTD